MSKRAINKEFDVLVLGAGAAGCVAASTIAAMGHSVAVVGRFGGASEQSSGAIDYSEAMQSEVATALDVLRKLASGVNLVATRESMLLASEAGTVKRAALAQETQACDLSSLKEGDSVTVMGFSGLSSFDAHVVARTLAWSLKNHLGRDINVSAFVCPVGSRGQWRSTLDMSRALEANAKEFVNTVISSDKARLTLMPAVLGRQNYRELWRAINSERKQVFEMLAMPTSVPGMRFRDALLGGLNKQSIELIVGDAVSAVHQDKKVTQIEIDMDAGSCSFSPKAVILASGRFLSGGFERQGLRREKIFGLPLWHQGQLIEDLPSRQLTTSGMKNAQPLLLAGLRVDHKSRPYDRMMDLFATNLFAAGSALEGPISIGRAALSGSLSAFHTLAALKPE